MNKNDNFDKLREIGDRAIGQIMQKEIDDMERELKLQSVSGFSSHQLIDLFLAGYTLTPPKSDSLGNAPAAVKAPKERAEWIPADYKPETYCKCSKCKRIVKWNERSKYCPNCGRKMRLCIHMMADGNCALHSDDNECVEP